MTSFLVRTSALVLAAAVSAGNLAATQALARHQVIVAQKVALGDAASRPQASGNGASVAQLKALWR